MTGNLNQYSISTAAQKIHKIAAEGMGANDMRDYQNKYKEVVEAYKNSSVDASAHLENFQPFQNWLPSLITNKDKIMPNLICNMLKKDTYAFNIYNIIQKATGSTDLLIDYNKIWNTPELLIAYKSIGGDQKAIAILNAVQWVSSNEAAKDVHDSIVAQKDLCAANGLLGVNNDFLDCSINGE